MTKLYCAHFAAEKLSRLHPNNPLPTDCADLVQCIARFISGHLIFVPKDALTAALDALYLLHNTSFLVRNVTAAESYGLWRYGL